MKCVKCPELVFAGTGLFTISVQLILFRTFLTVFSGNELSAGLFLFSWLVWTGAGAFAGSSSRIRRLIFSCVSFDTLVLLCIPVFIIQYFLLSNASEILGVGFYQQIPLNKLLFFVTLFNSPLSFATGFLFPLGCEWAGESSLPVAKVYISEAAGAFYGAVFSTIVLSYGISGDSLFLLITEKFVILILAYQLWSSKRVKLVPLSLLFLSLAAAFSGISEKWASASARARWKTILPGAEYVGSFSTAQARYSYGKYGDRFIIEAWGNVIESFPGGQLASEKISSDLAQKPDAQSILVIGNGPLGLAFKTAELPAVKNITVICTDPQYPVKLFFRLPMKYVSMSGKIKMPEMDLKKYLAGKEKEFDLVIMDCGMPSSLAANRFYMEESFKLIKKSLKDNGVLSVSFTGGDNYIGPELAYFGASLFETLKKVFPEIVLKPGDYSIFYCGLQKGELSEDPEILAKRLETLGVKERAFLRGNIAAMYQKDRIDFQKKVYASLKGVPLVNTASDPKSFLYAMLFTAKRLGSWKMPDKETIVKLSTYLPVYAGMFFIIVWFCRFLYLIGRIGERVWRPFELVSLMMFFAGAAMMLDILLIFNYQMEHGSIFLYFGLASSLFMLGIFAGGWIFRRFHGEYLIFLLGAGLFIASLIFYFCGQAATVFYGLFFLLCGFFPGAALAFCAVKFKKSGLSDAKAGAFLTASDCIGGAAGGISAALLLLPFAGTWGVQAAVLASALYMISGTLLFPLFGCKSGIIKGVLLVLLGAFLFITFIIFTSGSVKETSRTEIKTVPLGDL